MKSQIVSCAMLAFALSISCAFADEIKLTEGTGTAAKDTAVASKIVNNGLMPDGRECIVGTTPDCLAKDEKIASKIIGNGLMPDGQECTVGTADDCVAKAEQFASKIIGNGYKPDGSECIVGTARDCKPKRKIVASQSSIKGGLVESATAVSNK